MKIGTIAVSAVATALITSTALVGAPTAAADAAVGNFGSWQKLSDNGGTVVTAWQVSDLKPSSDTIASYPLAGKLWEASATVKAERGSITPIIPNFNARPGNDSATYRVLWQAATPTGISGATIQQGTESKGKIYFDVTGPNPTKVAYFNGAEDLFVWQGSASATAPPRGTTATQPTGTQPTGTQPTGTQPTGTQPGTVPAAVLPGTEAVPGQETAVVPGTEAITGQETPGGVPGASATAPGTEASVGPGGASATAPGGQANVGPGGANATAPGGQASVGPGGATACVPPHCVSTNP